MAHLYLSPPEAKSIRQKTIAKAINDSIRGGLYIAASDYYYDILNSAFAS
jgi:hypothetical protein